MTKQYSPELEQDIYGLRMAYEHAEDASATLDRVLTSLHRTAPFVLQRVILASEVAELLNKARHYMRHLFIEYVGEHEYLRVYGGGFHDQQADGEESR